MPQSESSPHQLSVVHACAMLVGIVVGIGIFAMPPLVAANSPNETVFLLLWAIGGLLTIIGALCYAELSSAYPHSGGEYHFLHRAYGTAPAFLFAWGRMTVMQTGAIALVGFVYGDYAQIILPLGAWGAAIHAAIAIIALSAMQLFGAMFSGRAQLVMTVLTVAALAAVAIIGIATGSPREVAPVDGESSGAVGLAMVFILLTYGGWNETAYLSGEVKDAPRNMWKVLVLGTLAVIALYLLVNVALLSAIGFEALKAAPTALADVVRQTFGTAGAIALSLIVIGAALTTMNATIFTGARSNHALGRSYGAFSLLGRRDPQSGAPVAAIMVQALIALALVGLGALTKDGVKTMVEYTAPVFWSFLLMIGISLFLFRMREPDRESPFRVPLYPVLPIIFCATCVYLLYSSLMYTGFGALVGVAILAAGVPVYLLVKGSNAEHLAGTPPVSEAARNA